MSREQPHPEDAFLAALQEFEAGALPALKEMVVTFPAGHVLLVAVDEQRQRPLAELFGAGGALSPGPRTVDTRWSLFYAEGRPTSARLDVAFHHPVRARVHVLFRLPQSVPCLRYVPQGARVCLVTRAAFAELEESRRCKGGLIRVPEAPHDHLERALIELGDG